MSEVTHYQEPLDRFEGLNKVALAEQIGDIQSREHDHQTALATTFEIGIPNAPKRQTELHVSQALVGTLLHGTAYTELIHEI
jgi:hypothetical protein